MDESKKPWQSKTIWVSLVMAILAFFPQVQAIIVANPEALGVGLGLVFTALRFISKDKIVIK